MLVLGKEKDNSKLKSMAIYKKINMMINTTMGKCKVKISLIIITIMVMGKVIKVYQTITKIRII